MEISAGSVYGKEIPGGAGAFIDRRAQEAYIGAVMGLIPIAGGGVTGAVKSRLSGRTDRVSAETEALGETLDPATEFTAQPEGVSTVETRDDVVPQEVERAVETERAAWDAQYGGRNVTNLEEQVRSLIDQVEGEKDNKKLHPAMIEGYLGD